MMLTISTSGGIGGFGLKRSAELRVEDLPQALQAETCELLTPERLERLADAPERGAADYIVYHITLAREGGPPTEYDLADTALPPEVLDLIDALLAEGRG
jgi:hypothetical protein